MESPKGSLFNLTSIQLGIHRQHTMPMGIMRFLWVSCFLILNTISIHGQRMFMEDECLTLSLWKQSLKFDSEFSYKLISWNSSSEYCCSWSGVTCENGHVVGLDLSFENINGGLSNSSSLFRLPYLKKLNLAYNNFVTPMPEAIATRLVNLRWLDLSYSGIQGTIPTDIFSIVSLEYLDISGNGFLGGSLPEFPLNGSLRTLSLRHTNVSGNLPSSIGNLVQLSTLDLYGCSFTGALPSSIRNLIRLESLVLSYNMFSGPVPDLSRFTKLTYLDLAGNSLTGPLPSSLFALPFLNSLLLSFNQFSGVLHEFPQTFSSPLSEIDLSSNKLEGPLPLSLFNFKNLSYLDLSYNNFKGSVELIDLQKLEALDTLDLSYNNWSIATSSSNLSWFPSGISKLVLASCNLNTFPKFVNHSALHHLDLSNNLIQGEIPKWIWNVDYVNLSNNLLEGFERPLPSMNSATVNTIDLHNNMLRGPLLPVVPKHAVFIDYSANRFGSTIPIHIGDYLSSTYFFSISNNQIVGTLPLSMCNATGLVSLDLSYNRISGTIPGCLFNMSGMLWILDLSGNKLEGAVPGTFSLGCTLRALDLNHNMLDGEIPKTLANCEGLEVLNLAYNRIHDKFPCWLKGLPSLGVLVLRSNELTGPVGCLNTMNLNLWRSLHIIDLANNKLFGPLPSDFFSKQKAMTEENPAPKEMGYLFTNTSADFYKITEVIKGQKLELVKILTVFTLVDFSSNMFNGEIPGNIGNLAAVQVLNLSRNALIGQIPSTLGNIKALESLDLSHNSLKGSIPERLKEVTFLSYLDLSFNQLEGMIPYGGQLQTFQETAFFGNKGLCGSPLSIKCKDARGSSSTLASPKVADIPSHDGFLIKWDFMVGSEVGFLFGLVITIAPLVLYTRWSRYYFRHLYNILLNTFGIRPNRRKRRYVSIIH